MSIWSRTYDALATLDPAVPMAANTYIAESASALPDEYLVFQLISSPPEQHADDAETLRSYLMQVSVYNRAGLHTLPDVNGVMTTAGFERAGYRDLPYDPETRHFGLAMDFTYMDTGT